MSVAKRSLQGSVSTDTITIENFYSKIKTKTNKLYNYPNKKLINMDLPFRALILGATGSGKTNILLNIIKLVGVFEKVVLIAKNLEEPLYVYLIDTFRAIEKKTKTRMLLASTSLSDLPAVNDFDPKENSLVIIDDFICDKPGDLAVVSELYIRGRKQSCSICFLSQSYFDIPKLIRHNANYIIIKKIYNTPDLKRILKEYSIQEDPKQVLNMYEQSVAGDFTNFFMIDVSTNDSKLRFRKNFEAINIQ